MTEFDIAIIGAGPAGLSVARCLAGSGLSVALVERAPEAALAEPAFDGREIALTHRSQALLKQLGAWDRIPAAEVSPLREAAVLDGTSPFALRFAPEGAGQRAPEGAGQRAPGGAGQRAPGGAGKWAPEGAGKPAAEGAGGEPLGALVPNHLIRRALFEALAAAGGATLIAGTAVAGIETSPAGARLALSDGRRIGARLVVAADTRFSEARRRMGIGATLRDFGKTMLVARLAHERPHHGIATEWFAHGQTIAMLPLNGQVSSAVITLPGPAIEALMAMPDAAFGAEVARRYGHRLGAMRPTGTRHAYPLVATYAHRFVGTRFALAGDAAVGMHPVTAHGFNLGLAGADRLAQAVRAAVGRGRDPADPGALLAYERGHRLATWPLFAATNAIAGLYTDDRAPARLLRAAVLRAGAALGPARRLVTRELMQPA